MSASGWGQQLPIFPYACPNCEEPRNFVQVAQWDVTPMVGEDFLPHQWSFGRCTHCSTPLLMVADFAYGQGGGDPFEVPTQVYPPVDRALPNEVPAHIRNAFAESQACLRAKAFTASVIMSRRVVEGIVYEKGYSKSGRNLEARLTKMKNENVLDSRLAEWADAVRLVGNEGAHEVQAAITRDEATETLGFVEALIDYIYVFQSRYDSFIGRRAARKQGINPWAIESADIWKTGASPDDPSSRPSGNDSQMWSTPETPRS